MTSEEMGSLEKISQDEMVEELVSDVLLVLLDERGEQQSCMCLDRLTDMLLEHFPQLQDILVSHGILQTSSNLVSLGN